MTEVRGLTGMRGVAALYVLWYHAASLGFATPGLLLLQSAGWSGVAFFFVLSGYLLFGLYSRAGVGRAYYLRRVFRTWPLYYLSLPLYAALGLVTVTPLTLLYLQNYLPATFANVPLWTLTTEEAFYFVLLPLVLRLKPDRGLLLATSVAVAALWGLTTPATDFWAKQLPAWFVCYAIGVWLSGRRVPKGWALPSVALCAVVFASSVVLFRGLEDTPFAPLMFGAAYGLVILLFQDSRAFTNRVAHVLGRASYGIYLFQLPLLLAFGVPLGVGLTLALSVASYYLFESRLVRFAHARWTP